MLISNDLVTLKLFHVSRFVSVGDKVSYRNGYVNTDIVVPLFEWCRTYVFGTVRRTLNLRSLFNLWYKEKHNTLGDGKKVIDTDDDAVFALGTLDEDDFVSLYLVMDEWCPQKGSTSEVRVMILMILMLI